MTREIVTSARDYYVAVNGDSANSGTSPSSPWPIQYAIDYVCHSLEIDNARVTIHAAQPASGQNYPPIILNPWFGTCNSDPGAVQDGQPGDCFTVPSLVGGDINSMSNFRIMGGPGGTGLLCFGNPQPWFVNGFTCMTPDGMGQVILADRHACLYLGNMLHGQSGDHVTAIQGSFIEYLRGFTQMFYGNSQRHATTLDPGSIIVAQPGTTVNGVTVPAAAIEAANFGSWPNFTHCFAYARGTNGVDLGSASFSGDATGIRYQGQLGGVVTMPSGVLPSLS